MDLDAITIELDLMDPALARWSLLDQCRQCRFNEAGVGRFDARFAGRHGSHKPHRKRQSHIAIPTVVLIDKVLQEKRHIPHLEIAAAA
jgi:hypothetical protein